MRFDLDRYYITVTVSDAGDGTIAAAVTAVEVWENGDPANARPITLGQGTRSSTRCSRTSTPPTTPCA